MTSIKIIGTSSSGNGYLIESGGQILIVECGLPLNSYLKGLNYDKDLGKVIGGIITHQHSDHLNHNTVHGLLKRGIQIYSHKQVCEIENDIKPLQFNKKNKVGEFYIQMFKAVHDVPNVGYLIDTPTKERIVFLTDTNYVPYKFNNVNCLMVECNNDLDVMVDNLMVNEFNMSKPENHLSLEDCVKFCKNNISVDLQKIILIHMSSTNINPDNAIKVVKSETSFFNVDYAKAGDEYVIEQSEF